MIVAAGLVIWHNLALKNEKIYSPKAKSIFFCIFAEIKQYGQGTDYCSQ